MFLKEHPRDPEEYKATNDLNEYPSFRDRYGLSEIRLDLGALGHDPRKPTTLGTNIEHLRVLMG